MSNAQTITQMRRSAVVASTHPYFDIPVIRPIFDRRTCSAVSPIFPYDFRRLLGVPEYGRAEQSATDVEVTAECGRIGDASKQRYLAGTEAG